MQQLVNTSTQVGAIISARRKALGISQQELASKIGISQSRLSILEADAAAMPLERLVVLLKLLGLELVIRDKTEGPSSKAQW